jgi:hypothetical protein
MPNVYTVNSQAGLSLPPATPIKLSDVQLARRRHQVAPVKGSKGFYVSSDRLTFKIGEKIEIEGELPKNLATLTDKPMPEAKPTLGRVQQDARDRGEVAKKPVPEAK